MKTDKFSGARPCENALIAGAQGPLLKASRRDLSIAVKSVIETPAAF
jgi:hypothetical protein